MKLFGLTILTALGLVSTFKFRYLPRQSLVHPSPIVGRKLAASAGKRSDINLRATPDGDEIDMENVPNDKPGFAPPLASTMFVVVLLASLSGYTTFAANADFIMDSEAYLSNELLNAETYISEEASIVVSYWRYFLSGAISASFAHWITVPFDVVKTRIQIDEELNGKGSIPALKEIVDNEGLGSLFTGAIPTVTGFFIQGGMKYGFFEVFKPFVRDLFENQHMVVDNVFVLMLAAGLAELIGSTLLTPFEAARIRLVADGSFADGVVDCVKKIIDQEGFGNLFLGLPPILVKNVPYTIMQLSIFELLTAQIYQYLSDSGFTAAEALQYRFGVTFISALVAAIVSSLTSQPGDTLLSIVNKNCRGDSCLVFDEALEESVLPSATTSRTGSRSSLDRRSSIGDIAATTSASTAGTGTGAANPFVIMRDAFEEIGVRGLFRGTQARLVHVIVIVVTQLLLYDTIKGLCGIPVTGFH